MPIHENPDRRRRRRRRRRRSERGGIATHSEGEVLNEMPERDFGLLSDGGVDLEIGELEMKVHKKREKRDCRICHLRLKEGISNSGDCAIELGCSCKGDLAAAHKQCAETWFKIRGNTTCEICGATAVNVVGEQTNETNATSAAAAAAAIATSAPPPFVSLAETQNLWQGRRLVNILLGCMVFAFIISWLFHFKLLHRHQ